MKFSQLTDELLREIILLYDKVVGGRGHYYLKNIRVKNVRDALIKKGHWNYRFGSRFSGHSKFWIRVVKLLDDGEPLIGFSFDANLEPEVERRTKPKKIEALSKALEKAIDDFLLSKNLAVDLGAVQ